MMDSLQFHQANLQWQPSKAVNTHNAHTTATEQRLYLQELGGDAMRTKYSKQIVINV